MRTHPNYGRGVVTLEEPEAEVSDEALRERLRAKFAAAGRGLPTLPTVALEVLQLSARPNLRIDELARLIERDLQLAAQVLRLARSPLHAGLAPVVSVSAAIVRLGLSAMRDVVLEAAMNLRVFKAAAYSDSMERVRCHSVAVAHLARAVARFTPMDAEFAFTCGLVHDAGFAGALVALGDAQAAQRPALTAQTWWAIDALHEELGQTLVGLWKMPAEVEMVVQHHHGLAVSGRDHPMLAILAIAEGIACREGLGLAPAPGDASLGGLFAREKDDKDRFDEAVARLRLTPPVVKAMNAEVAKVLPVLERVKK